MPLDPEVRQYLDRLAAAGGLPVETCTPEEARRGMTATIPDLGPPDAVAHVEDRLLAGPAGPLPVRVYSPRLEDGLSGIVFFHGGGWVVGSIDTHDGLARALANATGARVVSVEYRLAPEHPYPAAADDAYAAVCQVAARAGELGLSDSLTVAGDSAGGNLAAATCLRARDESGPRIAAQLLIYPVTDHAFETASYAQNADGFMLTRSAMQWYWRQYAGHERPLHEAFASPLRASNLAGLPPAAVMTAEYDPLRDEAEAYADRLAQAGVRVERLAYPGMIHGFLRRLNIFSAAPRALADLSAAYRRLRQA